MDVPHFVYPLILHINEYLGCFYIFPIVNNTVSEYKFLCGCMCSFFFIINLRVKFLGKNNNSMFNFLMISKKLHHFTCPQAMVPSFLHLNELLMLSDFLIVAILVGRKWYLTVCFDLHFPNRKLSIF